MKETDPNSFTMVAGTQLGLLWKSQIRTDWPTCKKRGLQWLSCCCYWDAWFETTVVPGLGRSKSNLVRRERPMNKTDGRTAVVPWGVARYKRRKLARRCENDRPSFSDLRMATLKVCTNLSANPFEEGWYGDTRMCLLPLNWQKLPNFSDTNFGPLSETSCSGNPFAANIFLSTATVCVAVVVDRVWWAMTMGVMVQQLGNFAPSGTGYKP